MCWRTILAALAFIGLVMLQVQSEQKSHEKRQSIKSAELNPVTESSNSANN